ncbi:conserved hypothetical protein [Leishmania braziliensis MHOM/BR/75/M2904]|uniref:Fe2OG dioxygenase domain-containing protein n=2 Tax=Leishmania braziliensis TaxID=5660 RepID=A4H8G0_LEIBR|nr:conserved hypothetical protein [Leishmania braziliensis MHOM/BR/75/M2904]CAJ2469626.1 unnamed protein product [Leishmania braziliensis]CAM37675.2 conserved hypothetical protein [Leishmania braziliensis MHOM/BR/75/M2904]
MAEKRYKLYELSRRDARRRPPLPETDLTDVVRLHELDRNTEENRRLIHRVVLPPRSHHNANTSLSAADKIHHDSDVVCYTFAGVPGLLLFPGVLSEAEQQRWCREAVLDYGDSEHHPNILSTHARAPQSTSCYQPPMRWATLGYSYEWTQKVYHRDRYSTFPSALRQRMCDLVSLVAEVRQDGFCCAYPDTYEPQTAIVNYYPVGSMMMCHQDVSEETLEQPLMSLSLGCSAVFLMGTQSREDAPHAFLLRSGDVAAFTGPSRAAFHSTPRILDDCPAYLTVPEDELTDAERSRYHHHAYYARSMPNGGFSRVDKASMTAEEQERYWRLCMRHMRVNINARQVYNVQCPFLFDAPHAMACGADTGTG